MRRVETLLNEYGESHQNKTNVLIHGIAVPAIYFVTFALIWSIPTPEFLNHFEITWAHVISIPVLWYYFKLSGPIGAAMTLFTILCFGGIRLLAYLDISVWQFSLALFVVMWILQFVGHKIEGKKPSFLKDIQFLLVGPAWWWVHWLKRFNIQY
ncbi:Mpo1-like protein [Aliiglaciecola sp. NS0011-25]|uniref:Mpo1 family 2-hydroxy fatty acid dioxygenase n=1 Tax=Aliiglaciecola sp. NS0011-25 TaxID=3127654 RepID=UPI0031072D59